jgi:hypothetical protein
MIPFNFALLDSFALCVNLCSLLELEWARQGDMRDEDTVRRQWDWDPFHSPVGRRTMRLWPVTPLVDGERGESWSDPVQRFETVAFFKRAREWPIDHWCVRGTENDHVALPTSHRIYASLPSFRWGVGTGDWEGKERDFLFLFSRSEFWFRSRALALLDGRERVKFGIVAFSFVFDNYCTIMD